MSAESFRGTKITQGHFAPHSFNKHLMMTLELLETGHTDLRFSILALYGFSRETTLIVALSPNMHGC